MTTSFQKSEQIVDRKVRNERILVPIGGHADELDSVYTLNDVAAVIWDSAIGGRTEAEIIQDVQTTFEIDLQTATADTRRLLDELISVGALRPNAEAI